MKLKLGFKCHALRYARNDLPAVGRRGSATLFGGTNALRLSGDLPILSARELNCIYSFGKQFCARHNLRNKSAAERYCCSENNAVLRDISFFCNQKEKYPFDPKEKKQTFSFV